MKRAAVIALRAALGIGAIAVGVAIFSGLVASKPAPVERAPADLGLLVAAEPVEVSTHTISIEVQGLVVPAEEVTMQAEVTGRVTWVNPAVIAGGRVSKGDVLVRIDARDYRLQVSQREADIERARVELELERGRKQVAEREWKLLGGDDAGEDARARALREPQIRSARNALAAARSGHDRARLMVEKTVVRAPFNAVVVAENVAPGQLVAPQSLIARLVASDAFHVRAAVPTAQLAAVRVPGVNAEAGQGSRVTVRHETGSGSITATGVVVRLLPDLDPAGQMAQVIVSVDDPLALRDGSRQPLLLASHVIAEIDAGTLENVIALPRAALHDGNEVFVMNEGALGVRDVDIVWRNGSQVFVRGGLGEGDRVVTSRITAPMPGMKLRADSGGDGDELAAY